MKSFQDYLREVKKHPLDVVPPFAGKPDKNDLAAVRAGAKTKKNTNVKEYVNDQGKLVEKPEVSVVADYTGPDAKTPPGDKKAAPYKAANDNVKSPTFSVEKSGLGELGDSKLKYQPNTDYKQEIVKSWNKTESFLNKTKGLSLSEFTQYMLDECGCGCDVKDEDLPYVTAYSTGKFQPHPPEAIKYVVVLANKNDNILDNVVREMKSNGMLGKVLKALLESPESYDELTSLFGDQEQGPNRCKLFAKSMNSNMSSFLKDQDSMYEGVSSPIGFGKRMNDKMDDEDMEDMGDEDMEDMGDEDMEDMGDEDMEDMDDEDMEDMGDEDMEDMDDEDMEDMGDEDMEDMGDEDMEDMGNEDMEDMDDEDMEDMGDEDMEDMGDEDIKIGDKAGQQLDASKMPRKLKKKFAHDHLLNAMRDFNLGK